MLYAYAFLDEFVLLYPVYALLFTDHDLSTAEISSLFVIWSVTGILLEVPSGAGADAVSRRLLLIVAPVLGGAGFGLWVAVPSYWAFALGFVLWGIRGALTSGALEALVYEELEQVGGTDRYASLMGRAAALGTVALLAATALAVPVFRLGGYPAVGVASVLACLLCAVVAVAFPEHRRSGRDGGGALAAMREYLGVLRSGLSEVRRNRGVRGAVLLVPAVSVIWGGLEEYTPLLARENAAADTVPILVLLLAAGGAVGGLLAGAGQRLAVRSGAAVLAAAALLCAGGALSRSPWGFVLMAVAFGVFQSATVVADARLQDAITGPARATVTSLAGFGTELATITLYGLYGISNARHSTAFAAFSLVYLVIAAALILCSRSRR